MYLHGDGGSSIFNTDSLDKKLPDLAHDAADAADEKIEQNIQLEKHRHKHST